MFNWKVKIFIRNRASKMKHSLLPHSWMPKPFWILGTTASRQCLQSRKLLGLEWRQRCKFMSWERTQRKEEHHLENHRQKSAQHVPINEEAWNWKTVPLNNSIITIQKTKVQRDDSARSYIKIEKGHWHNKYLPQILMKRRTTEIL